MGYMRHHVIVVTGSYDDWVRRAWKKAKEIFPIVSEIQQSGVNNVESFFVPPDGSKEGWDESDDGDRRRGRFVDWLNAQRYEDWSSPLDWAEIFYGDDNGEVSVVRHSKEKPKQDSTLYGRQPNDDTDHKENLQVSSGRSKGKKRERS